MAASPLFLISGTFPGRWVIFEGKTVRALDFWGVPQKVIDSRLVLHGIVLVELVHDLQYRALVVVILCSMEVALASHSDLPG